MCVWCAPATFRMEDEYGRSRVFAQWSNTEDDIEAAISERGPILHDNTCMPTHPNGV